METLFHSSFAIIGVLIFINLLALAGRIILDFFRMISGSKPIPEPEPEEDLWVPSPPRTTSRPIPQPTGYTKDWATVSRMHKEMNRWTCQDCGVCLELERNLLHVHHRDRNPQNNSFHNLEALCVICHSERPGAGHRRLAGAISNDGRRWRVEQQRRRW